MGILSLLLLLSIKDIYASGSTYTYPLGKDVEVLGIDTYKLSGIKGNVGYASGYPDLQYDSFLMRGCRSSYIDIPMPSGPITDDITFVLFVYAQVPLQGTILHYKASTWSNLNSDIKISLHGNLLLVSFTGGNGTIDYGTVSFPGKIEPDQWIALSIARDQSNGKLSVIINSTLEYDQDIYLDNINTVLPGKLRIGGSHDIESMYFTGRITCLNILNTVFKNPNEITKLRALCNVINWPLLPASTNTVIDSCSASKGFYKVNSNDQSPNSAIPTLNLMVNVSSIKCADLCSRTLNCKSFVILKTEKICKLFDNIYDYDLESYPEAMYYTLKDECC